MKILCVGLSTYDITIPMKTYPVENTKNRVDRRIECGGGPASTAAYLLGKWKTDVYFSGVVGNDEYGKTIVNEFKDANVNVDYLEVVDEVKTTSAFIIVNEVNGSRTVMTYRPSHIELEDLKLDFIPDIIHMDGQEYDQSVKLIEKYPDAITVIDAGSPRENVIALSHKVKYLICSNDFAIGVTGKKIDYNDDLSLLNIYNAMEEEFSSQKIVITLEKHGCMVKINGALKWIKSIDVKQVDSTGAGDIFHGAFIYYLSKGFEIEEVIKRANIAGGLSVRYIGTRNSIPSLEEVDKVYNGA